MIKQILIAVLLLTPLVHADEVCFDLQAKVETIHEARYENVPADEMWKRFQADKNPLASEIINKIYGQPRFGGAKRINEQRAEIASHYFLYCQEIRERVKNESK